jgi:dolichol-phosphate mannosyltransferase
MGADYIAQMDCDFSHPPDKLVEKMAKAPDYDVVIGSRYVKGGSLDTEWGWSASCSPGGPTGFTSP